MSALLPVLFQDDRIVVIDKPSGLLVHPTRLAAGEWESCVQLLARQLGRRVFPVHRLDRAASGVLIFALDAETASELTRFFREKKVHKTYYALVRGAVAPAGVIDKPLRKDKDSEYAPARSSYERVATVELPFAVGRYPTSRYSLVRVTTETGRLHQVRKHLVAIAHPIVGDTVYGEGRHNRFFRERYGIRRLMLFGGRVELPDRGFAAPWPAEFVALAREFGWELPGA